VSSTAKAKSDTGPETDRRAAGEAYRADGYALLEALFPPLVLARFHQRLQQDLDLRGNPAFLARGDLLTKPAIEVYSHQYSPMAAFHWGLTPIAAEMAGIELIPTYAYYRAYQQGDVCLVHSDRPACEHSLSLVIHLAEDLPPPYTHGCSLGTNSGDALPALVGLFGLGASLSARATRRRRRAR